MSAPKPRWIDGNDIRLLENGEEFFPRVFACIANARKEVVLETFILFEDKAGLQLHEALVAAARRGVQVDVTIDGFGSPDLSDHFISTLAEAGVRMHVFDPGKRLLGWRWSYGWRSEAMPSSLAVVWISLPYLLSHAANLITFVPRQIIRNFIGSRKLRKSQVEAECPPASFDPGAVARPVTQDRQPLTSSVVGMREYGNQ